MSSIRGSEVLNETWALTRQGRGHCVGRPLPGMNVRIVADSPALLAPAALNGLGEVGEIQVSGAVVTKEYFELPVETANAKVIGPDGTLWHRMGDMGYFDSVGRLWFCGRKAHRVIANGFSFYSVCCEAIFEEFLRAKMGIEARAALVAVSGQAALAVESTVKTRAAGVETAIVHAWKSEALAASIETVLFYAKPFPVDVRHNAKINREQIAREMTGRRD